ncbi:5-formyltetrahydrofolate cyclo-ligase [Desulfuromusa kysingii]|uniref:5-formyltetrahydrofolate cyclo-ligase n=1 Tax=Desulfuromusa kysingii TaxID=37625 RepID=A0A1H3WR59_9BACT|nr:5-formyltetrahydrofolate cyclo-ligase [Desulfuromusa kysingii]SDZ89440.1 5-formyltetrahydrofolate cyclo-ligase [Desulfuromusa kysingii]
MGKTGIRQDLIKRRKQLDLPTYLRLSQQAQSQLLNSECFDRATTIALYSAINNEVATGQIFSEARKQGKRTYYPRVNGDDLDFYEVFSPAELLPGYFGIAEPAVGAKASASQFDLIVVPGVAFDLRGNRLGYGRGFYDRQLAQQNKATISVGLSFDLQLATLLPTEDHDQTLDFIATETRFIPCPS